MKILVPVDGSKHSIEALKVATDYAKTKRAEIHLLNVVPFYGNIDLEISASAREKLSDILVRQGESTVEHANNMLISENVLSATKNVVISASIHDAIIDYAEKEGINLIIIGSLGLSPSSRFKLGSVASMVVKNAPCSVYVVKDEGKS